MSKKSYIEQYAKEQRAQVEKQKAEEEERKKEEIKKKEEEVKKKKEEVEKERQEQIYNEYIKAEAEKFLRKSQILAPLIKNIHPIDLHYKLLNDALLLVSSNAHMVAHEESIFCVEFIHGKGIHSNSCCQNEFDYDDDDLNPIIKPRTRELLETLEIKLNCKVVPGELLFTKASWEADIMHFASGVTFFMNEAYYQLILKLKEGIIKRMFTFTIEDVRNFIFRNYGDYILT